MNKLKTIYVVFKTHFDIGFTGLASEVVESYQGSMLQKALQICQLTSANPEGHRYVWTMPSWPLKKSLATTEPSLREQAIKLVEEGRLTWHALPFTTHTDFCGIEEFVRGLEINAELGRDFGQKRIAAKMTDVPGHTRMLPSLLAKAGVKFLHLGCNACVNPPEVPLCFFWQGPDGDGIVTFYTKGGYGTGLFPPEDWKYPVWLALMNTNDNEGPHSPEIIPEILQKVELKAPGVKVVIGNLDDFAQAFLACNPKLPVIDTDLADSWIHGVGTYPAEVSRLRALRKMVMNTEGVLALEGLFTGSPPDEDTKGSLSEVYENILLFDEHTWGLDTKLSLLPMHNGERVYAKQQFLEEKGSAVYQRLEASWEEKSGYVLMAEKALREVVNRRWAGDRTFRPTSAQRQAVLPSGAQSEAQQPAPNQEGKIAVYNLLAWNRDGEADLTGLVTLGQGLVDAAGRVYPVYNQITGCRVWLENLPALGCRVYTVTDHATAYHTRPLAVPDGAGGAILENSRIILSIDGKTGRIDRFFDKLNGKEWVAGEAPFGEYQYMVHGKERIVRYLKDYAYDLTDWYLADNGRPGYPRVNDRIFAATSCVVEITNTDRQGVVRVTWQMPEESVTKFGNAPSVIMEVSLAAEMGFADLVYRITDKVETPFAESGHFIFTLDAKNPQYAIQKMGAVFDPATDIQPGANNSLYCCDRWMTVTDGPYGIAFFPKDTPLLSIGENGIYRYTKAYKPNKPVLYWNAFNNQWGTNFPQWIGGNFRFAFRIYPYTGKWNETDLPKRAEEYATPLFPVKDGRAYALLAETIENATVLALKSANDGRGYILRLQESRGKKGELWLKLTEGRSVYARCDLLEEDSEVFPGSPGEVTIKTAPFEVHTLRII